MNSYNLVEKDGQVGIYTVEYIIVMNDLDFNSMINRSIKKKDVRFSSKIHV